MDNTITIETLDERIITGIVVDLPKINKIARQNTLGLIYHMNVLHFADYGKRYMWFEDNVTSVNYLVEI